MTIKKDQVVSINYTLKDNDGNVIDASKEGSPLTYLHGHRNIIPGLENALEGKTKGEKVQVSIPPEQAYGPRDEKMVQKLPMSQFGDPSKVAKGVQFQVDTDQGPMILTVVDIEGDQVVIDANHPMAGVTLNFDVEVHDLREATEEELTHGHAHGAGGHHH